MMKLYYQDDHATIYHADALDVLNGPFLGENEWVVVTDPPYGVDYVSNFAKSGQSKPIYGDNNIELRDNVLRLFAGSPMLVFGSWKMPTKKYKACSDME